MKSESKVKRKLKDAKYRYLKRELRDKMRCCPENCVYNQRHTVTSYRYVERDNGEREPQPVTTEVGLCMYGAEDPETWPGKICDDVQTALDCDLFQSLHTKEEVTESFNERLSDDVVVAEHYKDIAALQWVMQEDVRDLDLTVFQKVGIAVLFYFHVISDYVRKFGVS